MTLPLAHIGHWYHALLYAAPVILIALALWWSGRRDDRRRAERARERAAARGIGPEPGEGD